MKINSKILSIPPFISTVWHNVSSISMSGTDLVIHFIDGESVKIPDLAPDVIEQIFATHEKFIEEDDDSLMTPDLTQFRSKLSQALGDSEEGGFPLRFGLTAMDGMGSPLHHDSSQMYAPDVPQEILDRIRQIVKILSPNEAAQAPKPEPHCNCLHCQIARAVHEGLVGDEEIVDTIDVTDEDLQFQQWEIVDLGEQRFTVTNKLDRDEQYNVFLGEPVGCTCGKEGCEHIVAVLKS